VAIRPLRVAELAEVIAVDFDDAEGIPKLNADWRWDDQEQALLIACSSLIAIVKAGDSRVVQFSHFSVKEFLTSPRLATTSGVASNYLIDLKLAHTTLAQACLGVLLRTQYDVDGHTPEDHQLAQYAALHWTTHAQFEDVSSRLQKGMEYLFDRDKPHFEVWRMLYDIDVKPDFDTTFYLITMGHSREPAAAPLYYAALCGFHDLVEHLITGYPQDVNASGGCYGKPLVAALAGKHFQTAELLRQNGANPYTRGYIMRTPLHSAAYYGDREVAQKLIEYNADVSAMDDNGRTPLYTASEGLNLKDRSVLHLLLEHGADIDARANDGQTPLHNASSFGALEVARLLVEGGADVNARAEDGRTPLHKASASYPVSLELVQMLLEHGADVNARAEDGWTPLHKALASYRVSLELVQMLLEHGADVNARAINGKTPLHEAVYSSGGLEVVRLLLERGADVTAEDDNGVTPLREHGRDEVMELLLEHYRKVHCRD
jgi:ankyrin repeat protein